jgi:hypothetical protein
MGIKEEILGNHGAAHTLTHAGKTYTVRLVDQHVQTGFAKALFARAREAARELKDLMTPEEWAAHLRALNHDYIQGEYAMLSPRGRSVLLTEDGLAILGPLLFGCDFGEFLGLLIGCKEEALSLLRLVLYESFPGLEGLVKEAGAKAGGQDPNPPGPRPEATPAGA